MESNQILENKVVKLEKEIKNLKDAIAIYASEMTKSILEVGVYAESVANIANLLSYQLLIVTNSLKCAMPEVFDENKNYVVKILSDSQNNNLVGQFMTNEKLQALVASIKVINKISDEYVAQMKRTKNDQMKNLPSFKNDDEDVMDWFKRFLGEGDDM